MRTVRGNFWGFFMSCWMVGKVPDPPKEKMMVPKASMKL